MPGVDNALNDIKLSLARIEAQLAHKPNMSDFEMLRDNFAALRADNAGIKGRIAGLPTAWTLAIILIMTWSAGVGIVGFLAR